jgi:hypothetical protein
VTAVDEPVAAEDARRRRIRVIVDKAREFEPPPGTSVIGGTEFSEVSELVLLVPQSGSQAASSAPRDAHHVRCPSCAALFDLFAARWCDHADLRPSKVCPCCGRCVCADVDYRDPRCWREAPPAFQRYGIRDLFVRYL